MNKYTLLISLSATPLLHDFGKQYPDSFLRESDDRNILGRPGPEIRNPLVALGSRQTRNEFQSGMVSHLETIQQRDSWRHVPETDDILFEASYPHEHHKKGYSTSWLRFGSDISKQVCEDALVQDCISLGCDTNRITRRRDHKQKSYAAIHIWIIASADTVVESGIHRDKLVKAVDTSEWVVSLES